MRHESIDDVRQASDMKLRREMVDKNQLTPRRDFLRTCAVSGWSATSGMQLIGPATLARAQAPASSSAAGAKPLKITPGQVIVPTDRMRRPWGELMSIDLATRTGKFRREGTDEVISFTVLPYAELYHHAAFGDLQDFRVGTRAIFRLHENKQGEWVWLTYIQDEMNFLFGHKEYYHVDRIDPDRGRLEVTDASADKSFVRTKGIILETDRETRFWSEGKAAQFADIQLGDKLRTETHGVGKGQTRVCWQVFLDDKSLGDFQAAQQAVHARRMAEEGLPGYVASCQDSILELTLFRETSALVSKLLRVDRPARVAPAGVDRKPNGPPITGVVKQIKPISGALTQVTLQLASSSESLAVGTLTRLWAAT